MPCYFWLPCFCWVDVWTWAGFVHPLNPRLLPVQFCCADWLFHFPLSLLVMGFWHSSSPFCVAVLVQEPAGHRGKRLCESHSHADLGQCCCHLCFLMSVSWIFWAWKYLFKWWLSLSPLPSSHAYHIILSHLWWTGLQPWQWRGAAEPGTSVELCSEFAALVKGCRFANQSLHWRWKMLM